MKRVIFCFVAIIAYFGQAAHAQVVTKLAEGFEFGAWKADDGATVGGSARVVDEAAPGTPSSKALLMEPSFTGQFGGFGVQPATPLVIPGDAKTISFHTRISDKRFGLKVGFKDGWGRDTVNGKPLQWQPKIDPKGEWQKVTFDIPADWVKPITLAGIGTDNWEAKADKIKVQVLIDQIEVQTDITNVDPATGLLTTWKPDPASAANAKALKAPPKTELVQISVSTRAMANVFSGEEPSASVKVQNWKPDAMKGVINCRVIDERTGNVVAGHTVETNIESVAGFDWPMKIPGYGVYKLVVDANLGDAKFKQEAAIAKIPPRTKLTEEQKEASPYGLNYHGGGRLMLKPFRDAGLVWYREYAFGYDAIAQAKAGGTYTGWPFFPRMLQAYQDADARVMAVLQKSIKAPKVENGKVVGPIGPSVEWTRNIADVMIQFPQITHWEMANEYDLPAANASAERLVNWENYKKYHAKLGELVELFGGGKWTAVENGRAGIFPELVLDCVQSRYFDKIGVVNSHHYTGTDAPEENYQNYNTTSEAWGGKSASLMFDQLRDTTRAGQADGKMRQHWFTEFGWDTLAGPVVTPYEQAVFLQRGYMLSIAAGCSKAFWFFHFDSANPKVFFDGCGLLTQDAQPKLALAATAGMTSVLPTPKYVGPINAGDNTGGYVFEQDGKLVAALFTIRGDDGPSVTLKAEKLYDYLGNEIAGKTAKLSMAPVFAVGLDRADPFALQAAYSIDSATMPVASSGDPVESVLLVNNTRETAISGQVTLNLPEGWKTEQPTLSVNVAPGQQQRIPFTFTVGPNEPRGVRDVKIAIAEQQPIKIIPMKVMIQPRAIFTVSPITGQPGETELTLKIGNKSKRDIAGAVVIALPKAWSTNEAKIRVDPIKPGELREVKSKISWRPEWGAGESATATFETDDGTKISQPIIPNQLAIRKAAGVKIDGELSDWPAANELPGWVLGTTIGKPDARVFLAWSPEGLYGAIEANDSKVQVKDPESFWAGDVLELFVDTADNKTPRTFAAGDHQFFLVPQPAQNRVYLGRWKVKDEIPKTLFDIREITSAAKQTKGGYVMEFMIPASQLQNYKPEAGKRIGLNLNLTVNGQANRREVFWSRAKGATVNTTPANWGSVQLVE